MLIDKEKAIEKDLMEFMEANPYQTWATLLMYCLGYYGEVNYIHISVVRQMQREGKVRA